MQRHNRKLARRFCATLLLWLSSAAVAAAGSISFTGSTVGRPSFNRPDENQDRPPVSLSGERVPFDVFAFTVNVTGTYNFTSAATNPANWDNFTLLYADAFDPTRPLINVLIANDDNPSVGRSGFSYGLIAGRRYFFVVTGYTAASVGTYAATIDGPGTIFPLPEPTTAVLTVIGLLGLGCHRRRRSCSTHAKQSLHETDR